MSSKHKEWIKLKSLPIYTGNVAVTSINNYEFVIAQYRENHHGVNDSKIYKFNTNLNKLESYIDYESDLISEHHTIIYDDTKNKLYLYSFISKTMTIINVNTKKFEIIWECDADCYSVPSLVSVKGTIHLIGGLKHFTWNDDNKSLKKVDDFPNFSTIVGSSAIYISSKDIIVLIGGYGRYGDPFDFNTEKVSIGIWIFHLKSKKWKQIKQKCPWTVSRAVMTSNEKYIIFAGTEWENGDKIYILEIRNNDTMILRKSNICCPMEGFHHMVRSGDRLKDEMLVIGYVKSLFNTKEFINLTLPPFYIITLIVKWYNIECIHWLQCGGRGDNDDDDDEYYDEEEENNDEQNCHYMIPVKTILSSIDTNQKQEIIKIL